jgi:osmotically-inducible protein OsmY
MKKTLFAVTIISVLITGCFPVVLVGAGAAGVAAIATDSRSLQTISDDTNIQHEASQKLKTEPAFAEGSDITVTSFNYVVLLTGQVPSDALRVKAEQIVQGVPRIRRVYNMIQVAPVQGNLQAMDDATISTNIKARMTVTSNLNSNNFKFVVENKVAYLMGYATHEQAKLALDVVRNSSGVAKVVNLVQYSDDAPAASTTTADTSSAPVTSPAATTPATPTTPGADTSTTNNTTTVSPAPSFTETSAT